MHTYRLRFCKLREPEHSSKSTPSLSVPSPPQHVWNWTTVRRASLPLQWYHCGSVYRRSGIGGSVYHRSDRGERLWLDHHSPGYLIWNIYIYIHAVEQSGRQFSARWQSNLYDVIVCLADCPVCVSVKPMIWVPNQLLDGVQGFSVTLKCRSEAFPLPIAYWMKTNGDQERLIMDERKEKYDIKIVRITCAWRRPWKRMTMDFIKIGELLIWCTKWESDTRRRMW